MVTGGNCSEIFYGARPSVRKVESSSRNSRSCAYWFSVLFTGPTVRWAAGKITLGSYKLLKKARHQRQQSNSTQELHLPIRSSSCSSCGLPMLFCLPVFRLRSSYIFFITAHSPVQLNNRPHRNPVLVLALLVRTNNTFEGLPSATMSLVAACTHDGASSSSLARFGNCTSGPANSVAAVCTVPAHVATCGLHRAFLGSRQNVRTSADVDPVERVVTSKRLWTLRCCCRCYLQQ